MSSARLKLHVIGPFVRGQVRTRWVPETRPRLVEVEDAIDQAWDRASRRPGVRLFDLPMCRLESFQANQELLLSLSLTTYKAFLGTNYAHPELARLHGPQILANPLGISAIVHTHDDFFLLGRRNASVAHYPGRAHPFAGTLEPAEADDVFAAIERELREEIHITGEEISSIHCLGLAEDTCIGQPELIFHVRSNRARASIEQHLDDTEHSGTFVITADAQTVRNAIDDPLLTPIAAGALLLCGRELFGAEWFEEAQSEVTVAKHGP
jgi:8-oxo-dGTP pyrophosphatase MutT (NUDIX family)